MKLPFRRKRPAAPQAQFKFRVDGETLRLTLESQGVDVAFENWEAARPDAIPGLTALHAARETLLEGERTEVQVLGDEVLIGPALLARMDTAAASALGLPAASSLALDLKPVGLISDEDFQLEAKWVRPGGQPVRSKVSGALIETSDGVRRIPEPLWSLWRAARSLEQPTERAERFRALAALRAAWPDDPAARVDTEPYLKDLRVHYAASLSLKLRTLTPERTDFDPVLFGSRSVSQAEEEGRSLDEELDNVLTPSAQKLFAEDRFRAERDARPVYVLRDGEYVFIDPALRPVLGAVRRLQDRPEADRRAFILNPRQVLREQLGEVAEQLSLDHLFVETEQFSDRVAGVDVWRAPVLPWLTPVGQNNWLPERFGLRIGEDYFVLPPENAEPLLDRLENAAAKGQPTAIVGDLLEPGSEGGPPPPRDIAVTEQTIAAVRDLAPIAHAALQPETPEEDNEHLEGIYPNGKLFLVVRENFEAVEFASPLDRAEAPVAFPAVSAPKRLRTSLKSHQVEGLDWLAQSALSGRPGGLLADDMGLGKTLQAIAFMAWLQDEAKSGRRASQPFLIVAPTGLLGTWRDEISKHLCDPELGLLVPAFGSDLRTLREESGLSARDIETGRSSLRNEAWRDAGVVLTTYETMRDYHFSFARTQFGLVVYDEIQKLKNPTSQMTRAAKALNGAFTLGMTGTPVENRLQDLWSIMDVIAPGLLGSSRDFERRHPAHDTAALAKLKSQLTDGQNGRPAYMLRRLKADALASLPRKYVHPVETEMPEVQAKAYRDLIVRAAAAASAGTMGKGGMLSTLAAMRGVSLHPLDPRQAPGDLDAYAKDSARLAHTLRVLDDVAAKQEKALVFVEDLAMQERLAGLIKERFKLLHLPTRINGGVPGHKRQALVTAFQANRDRFDVMILSPKAGGVGLTLTSANHVIHLSRWWNPAVEDQATDRVFRIGQTRDVHVHLPIAVHPDPAIRPSSFDLRLNALIERKRQLTRDLFLPPEPSENELGELFREVSLGEAGTGPPDVEAQDAVSPAPVIPAAPNETTASLDTSSRPTLSLPKPLTNSGVRYWRLGAGAARPTDEILEIFRGREITQVTIRDPYALASARGRSAQIQFLAQLAKVARRLDGALIEYAPEAEGDLVEAGARRHVGELLSSAFPAAPPKLSLVRRPKRSRDDDFHDRTIELSVVHAGGATRQHELSIGRGAEALFDDRRQCTVTYVPPSA